MDVKLEEIVVALHFGDDEYEAQTNAKYREDMDERKNELERKAAQLSVAQAGAEEMLRRQTD